MVPGIDFAGVIVSSGNPEYQPGEAFVVTGCELGELHWGGLAQKIKLKSDWLVRLPESMTTSRAMAIGTAGYTAMLCIMALEKHGIRPGDGDILVTGASGGVGSIAVAVLGKLGYRVVASTGKLAESDYLKELGASEIIDRATLSASGKPLQKMRDARVVDSVGSHTLANACRADQTVRGRCCLRAGAGNGFSCDSRALHSAGSDAIRINPASPRCLCARKPGSGWRPILIRASWILMTQEISLPRIEVVNFEQSCASFGNKPFLYRFD